MPAYIVKVEPDEDCYVRWSDIVEAPTFWGTRAEFAEVRRFTAGDIAPERFDRADRTGSSALWPSAMEPIYGWASHGFVYMQQGILPRARLRELCQRLTANANADVRDLLEPFEDAGA